MLYHNFVSILPLIVHRSADMFSLPSVLGWSFDSFRFNESFIHEVRSFFPSSLSLEPSADFVDVVLPPSPTPTLKSIMQLTANFVVLATALAYSSSSVLALPVDSTYATRDVEYDLEAREVGPSDMLEYSTRELYDMYLEARGYYDEGLDARDYHDIEMEAREYVEDLEARAVEACLSVLLTPNQMLTWFFS